MMRDLEMTYGGIVAQQSHSADERGLEELPKLFSELPSQNFELGSQAAASIFEFLAQVLLTGMKQPPVVFFRDLVEQMNHDSVEQPGILRLQSAVQEAGEEAADKSPMKTAALFLLGLLRRSLLSAFFRYLAGATTQKKISYFEDSLLHNRQLCLKLAEYCERIDLLDVTGDLPISKLRHALLPVSPDRFLMRINESVNNFVTQFRGWIFDGCDPSKYPSREILMVVDLVTTALLLLDDGKMANLEVLWELFEQICAARRPHVRFQEFVEIMEREEKFSSARKKRVMNVLWGLLVNGLLPFWMVFLVGATATKHISTPAYWRDQLNCVRMGHALLPLRGVPIEMKQIEFQKHMDSCFA
jgi:hypothetical protein